ncbi:MAG: TIGR04255 family protein [Acidimicrobiaceae bacterium]|nr:TIGR04255 family protein [Acidimicrobiaceae bacterium]MXZ98837.1 TIGR04255 family protein [Acidimicrobiaceae bacterium]MYE76985.1 TIGR04255 family protein [Acidimicrobiaceae bacterium]MYE96998.1 TIGR04255 family protein [Acidimicrobiaceae bacterium]MYH42649.1 TIGR04255 family protein [Acidimicrobiaceae bacterium]
MVDEVALPAYERPPVVEVALAIEFDQAIGFRALDLGNLAAAWADSLPVADERPPLPRMEWLDDDLVDDLLDALFDDEERVAPPRLWLQSSAGDQVVQIQRDRIVVNWRKEGSGDYPRYEIVRDRLQDAWRRLIQVCDDLNQDAPEPNLCEIQYINNIGIDEGWKSPQDTEKLITSWQGVDDNSYIPSKHLCQFSLHCHFPDDREGWLNIDGWTTSAPTDDDADAMRMVLNLTSRGHALSNDLDSALDFFDMAHVWIIRGFTAITSPEAHDTWGRIQ